MRGSRNFVRGGPTLTTVFWGYFEGRGDPNAIIGPLGLFVSGPMMGR